MAASVDKDLPREWTTPVVICSQLPDNDNTSVTNMAEYLAAEIIRSAACLRRWCGRSIIPSMKERSGEYFLVRFAQFEVKQHG